jgi:crossover junction endodeoxyribonuclease RusA
MLMNAVELPFPPRALSPNVRCHWRVKARIGKDYKRTVYYLCKEAGLAHSGDEKVHLSVNFYPPSRHAFDQDNVISSCKFCMDSIADYLHVNDKNFIYHWFYHEFKPDFKGKVVVEIIPDPNFANVVKIREHVDNSTEKATK